MGSKLKARSRAMAGIVDVHVHHAAGLPNLSEFGEQDVYARFLFGKPDFMSNAALQTKTIRKGGTRPVFDQTLQIGVPEGEQVLTCEVYAAQPRGRDRLVGSMMVSLDALISQKAQNKRPTEYMLRSHHLDAPAGCISLTLAYHGRQTGASNSSTSPPRQPAPPTETCVTRGGNDAVRAALQSFRGMISEGTCLNGSNGRNDTAHFDVDKLRSPLPKGAVRHCASEALKAASLRLEEISKVAEKVSQEDAAGGAFTLRLSSISPFLDDVKHDVKAKAGVQELDDERPVKAAAGEAEATAESGEGRLMQLLPPDKCRGADCDNKVPIDGPSSPPQGREASFTESLSSAFKPYCSPGRAPAVRPSPLSRVPGFAGVSTTADATPSSLAHLTESVQDRDLPSLSLAPCYHSPKAQQLDHFEDGHLAKRFKKAHNAPDKSVQVAEKHPPGIAAVEELRLAFGLAPTSSTKWKAMASSVGEDQAMRSPGNRPDLHKSLGRRPAKRPLVEALKHAASVGEDTITPTSVLQEQPSEGTSWRSEGAVSEHLGTTAESQTTSSTTFDPQRAATWHSGMPLDRWPTPSSQVKHALFEVLQTATNHAKTKASKGEEGRKEATGHTLEEEERKGSSASPSSSNSSELSKIENLSTDGALPGAFWAWQMLCRKSNGITFKEGDAWPGESASQGGAGPAAKVAGSVGTAAQGHCSSGTGEASAEEDLKLGVQPPAGVEESAIDEAARRRGWRAFWERLDAERRDSACRAGNIRYGSHAFF